MRRLVQWVASFVLVGALPAGAATMTFKDLPHEFDLVVLGPSTYSEAGITATSNDDFASFTRLQAAHLDDGGSSFASILTFTMASRFNAISFDLLPLATDFDFDVFGGSIGDLYNNVHIVGTRAGSVVAEKKFSAGTTDNTFSFGAAFSNLDSLSIAAILPDFSKIGGACFDSPCGHFDVDNVSLNSVAAVPLPAGLPLMLSVMGIFGLLGWRRRNRAQA